MWLSTININLGASISFESIFLSPLGRGDSFNLYLAAWFLFNLYVISVFASIVFQKNTKINIGIIILSILTMLIFLHIGNNDDNPTWIIFLSRSFFGFGFFCLGYLFKTVEPIIKSHIIKPAVLVILYLIVNVLGANFGNIYYSILFGSVSNDIFIIPVITSLCIIGIIYILSHYDSKILRSNSILYEIGQYSFAIMVLHLTFFFIVNVFLYYLNFIPYTALSDVYYRHDIEKFWIFYQIPAIILPVLIMKKYNNFKGWLISFVKNINR